MSNETSTPPATRVIFSNDARKELFKGLEIVANAVGATLGPKGKTVLIQQNAGAPIVTKDGVTVSKSINLKSPVPRMGAQLIREAASQTNDTAGDGTTTATILTHAMVKTGLKLLAGGYSAKELCHGIETTTAKVLKRLKHNAKNITSSEEITQIATISANGDKAIGELIAEAMTQVGRDGVITVEEAKGMSTSLAVAEGMQIERGYLSPYFVTNSEKMHAAYVNARVLIVDGKLTSLAKLVPILEKIVQSQTPLLIIAEDVEGEALQGLVLNRVRANLPVVAIRAPGYGQHREELLRDIAVLTGGKVVSSSTGVKVDDIRLDDLGKVSRFITDAKSTTLVSTGATKEAVDEHVQNLRTQLEDITLSSEEIVKLKMRVAKLASGVAVIKVGGATEVEMIERKYRIEDALNATRAAAEEGIVPGGGMALYEVWRHLDSDDTEIVGEEIVKDALLAPVRKIAQNAGASADVVINELSRLNPVSSEKISYGWNAATGMYEDLVESGVIDPVKVTRTALRNAASVAVTFLSLDAVIVDDGSETEK
jgi:chaperonin GroEL